LFFVAGFTEAVEVGVADVFGFDESYWDLFAGDDVVGGATGLTFGFVGGTDFGDEGFDELLEVATKGVFGGVAQVVAFVYGVDVLLYSHLVVLYITKIMILGDKYFHK
jgi:hypothetical protein